MRYLLLYTCFFLLFFTMAGHASQNRITSSYGIVSRADSSNKILYNGIRLPEVWPPDSRSSMDASPMSVVPVLTVWLTIKV